MTFAQLCHRVRADLGQAHRYEHCVRVARLADRLAQHHGENPYKARIAGMLHDLARLYSSERLIAESRSYGLTIADFELASPVLLHARLGAALAAAHYAITDDEILSAIRKHTTADAQMSNLDSILYLADSLEPGRSYEGRERLEALAFFDLKGALREVLSASAQYCHSLGLVLSPPTVQAAHAFGVLLPEVSPVHTT